MEHIVRDYFLLIFLSAIGVLQIAAAYAEIRGLLLLRRRILSYILGIAFTGGAFLWFFASGERNIRTVVEGTEQLGLFAAGVIAALSFTFAASSLANRRLSSAGEGDGWESLRNTTFLKALIAKWRSLR